MLGESVTANQIAGNIHIYLRNLLEDAPYIFVQNAVRLKVQEGSLPHSGFSDLQREW